MKALNSGTGCCKCLVVVALVITGAGCQPVKPPSNSTTTPGTESAPDAAKAVPSATEGTVAVGEFRFAKIRPGKFSMGSPQDEPGHESSESEHSVEISYTFGMAIYEVTVKQYWQVVDVGHVVPDKDRDKPVANVSWDEAVDFCRQLSDLHSGRRFRLPNEAEWEYACRAGQSQMFSVWVDGPDGPDWSDLDQAVAAHRSGDPNRLARRAVRVIRFDSGEPAAVGSLSPNPWGLYDMHGNVWEWCDIGPGDDDAPSLNHRPMRGGAWVSTTCLDCRAAKRAWQRRGERTAAIGFRVVLENP